MFFFFLCIYWFNFQSDIGLFLPVVLGNTGKFVVYVVSGIGA